MCLLDYDFAILNNAFLIHRPGIKTRDKARAQNKHGIGIRNKQKHLVNHKIIPELEQSHGKRKDCSA